MLLRPVVAASGFTRCNPPMSKPEVSEYSEKSMTSTLRAGLARAASQASWKSMNVLPLPPLLLANTTLCEAGMLGVD